MGENSSFSNAYMVVLIEEVHAEIPLIWTSIILKETSFSSVFLAPCGQPTTIPLNNEPQQQKSKSHNLKKQNHVIYLSRNIFNRYAHRIILE